MLSSRTSKILFFGSSALVLIVCIEPRVFQKLINLIQSITSAVIGVSLGVFIFVKMIDYVVDHDMVNQRSPGPRVGHPGGESFSKFTLGQTVLSGNDGQPPSLRVIHGPPGIFSRCWMKLKGFFNSILFSLSKSPILQIQMKQSVNAGAPCSRVHLTLKELGRSPQSQTRFGTYVCVSQNIDVRMKRIFEYSYRDYVETWYGKVSSDRGKLHELVREDFWSTYQVFADRLSKIDIVNLVMNRYITTLLKHFQDLAASDPLYVKILTKSNARSSVCSYMYRKKNNTSFTLHPCLRNQKSELEFLRRICDYIILLCFPQHLTDTSSAGLILREILAGLAFQPMIESICDPDYINQTILMTIQRKENEETEKTRAYMYAANYEDFIKIINETKSVTELQQIRYRIMTEVMHATTISSLKKDTKKAGKARSMAKGELLISRNLKRYINQCQVAKQQCEKRIRALGGDDYGNAVGGQEEENLLSYQSQVHLLTFAEVMKSPMARSYLMKYLKKIDKSSLLKYWNEVEIIRSAKPAGKDLAKLVSHVYQTYVLPGNTNEIPIQIDRATVRGMQACVVGNKTPEDFYRIQEQAYRLLEKDHYPSFVVSEFYIHQLVPQLHDQEGHKTFNYSDSSLERQEHRNAAFGSRQSVSDRALSHLKSIEEKLEYKAQALESFKPNSKHDTKVTKQLQQEISNLQKEKLKQQLHIERSEAWWSRMGSWNATIDKVQTFSGEGEGAKIPIYTIIVLCSGVPFYESTDDVSGWVVVRSLSDFHKLHLSLKELRPWLQKVRLPTTPMLRLRGLSEKFLNNSKELLNQYLKDIMQDEILRCSELVYAFLSQTPEVLSDQSGDMKRQRRTNLLQKAEENVFSAGTRKKSLWDIGGLLLNIPRDIVDYVRHSEEEDEISDADELDADDSLTDRDSIAGPMYQLIREIFEIQGVFRPLRQTLIVFVRIAFGGTINKHIRDTLQWLVSDSMLTYYLQTFIDSMWPDGQLAQKSNERTEDEKKQTALEVQVKILQNIPETLQSFVGQENARRGMIKIYQALQNKQLNKHLFYNLLTETVEEIFPEILRSNSTVDT